MCKTSSLWENNHTVWNQSNEPCVSKIIEWHPGGWGNPYSYDFVKLNKKAESSDGIKFESSPNR